MGLDLIVRNVTFRNFPISTPLCSGEGVIQLVKLS